MTEVKQENPDIIFLETQIKSIQEQVKRYHQMIKESLIIIKALKNELNRRKKTKN